jgi:hypothetical protein
MMDIGAPLKGIYRLQQTSYSLVISSLRGCPHNQRDLVDMEEGAGQRDQFFPAK